MRHLFFIVAMASYCRQFVIFVETFFVRCYLMKLLKIYPTSVNDRFISEAVEALEEGLPVVYPTDSVYALGCNALDVRAVENLCRLKNLNPRKDLLSIICADLSMASEYAMIDNRAFRYIKEYTPGPATFILPSSTRLPKVFRGRRTVGLRIPDSPVALELCRALGGPILSTSVALEPVEGADPDAVALHYAGNLSLMIDSGSLPGVPTTIVDMTDSSSPEVTRQGSLIFEP